MTVTVVGSRGADQISALDGLVEAGLEVGAAVAVVRDGVVEIDHCVGTTDGSDAWRSDTLVMTFSVAKPFAALAFLDAVAEGQVSLDQPVATVWPEFARHGKEATTMRHLSSHQAGLPMFPPGAADVRLPTTERALIALLADSAPLPPPWRGSRESMPLTYGHLLDAVLRRASGASRSQSRFARVAGAAGWTSTCR